MLYFLHNTYNRPNTVIKHSLLEKAIFTESKHIIVYNNKDIDFENNDFNCYYFGENMGHKAGSLNAVLSGIKIIIDNFNILDDDIIIFSHDDIYLSNENKFKSFLNKINEHDFIARRCISEKFTPDNCNHYIMMETFLINGVLSKKITQNYIINSITENDLLLDKRESHCPEMSFGKIILNNSTNPFLIDIKNNSYGENDLGYFHIENERGIGEF